MLQWRLPGVGSGIEYITGGSVNILLTETEILSIKKGNLSNLLWRVLIQKYPINEVYSASRFGQRHQQKWVVIITDFSPGVRSCRPWGTRTTPAASAAWSAPRRWTACRSPWTSTATSTASQTTTSESLAYAKHQFSHVTLEVPYFRSSSSKRKHNRPFSFPYI